MRRDVRWTGAAVLALTLLATPASAHSAEDVTAPPTVEEARELVERAEAQLREKWIHSGHADWVQANFITHDTEILAAKAREEAIAATMGFAKEAARFDALDIASTDPDLARKLRLLKLALTLPAPSDPAKTSELTKITTQMESIYGSGEYCPEGATGEDCLDLQELSKIIAESRDPAELARAWAGWRTVSPEIEPLYARYVELANEGARELGFADLGAMWRAKYDMEPDAFAAEVERLWQQVRPLYESLHCYVRAELNEEYGGEVVPLDQPIRADLLGNMWAQEWGYIYPLVAPEGGDSAVDVTALLEAKGVDPLEMVRYGERFFSSLGFEPLPDSFWERSLFTKPADRDVVCHASAWNLDYQDDLRIKMCIQVNEEDFVTIHHELGHNYYQRAYNTLPFLYQDSANDGFHEAVGDTLALSVTPEYLVEVGLLDAAPPAENDIGLLLKSAMDKVAFLPFGLLIDQWRWKVFAGEFSPEEYNASWWQLREKYQGIRPPVARSEADFDPGAKYHIPANVPYTRYFLARILQFQFHKALCEIAGDTGPLHRCSIYDSAEAGKALGDMLAMGLSKPWPEALEALTGSRQMDASAMVDYYRPLLDWLAEQNEGRSCGW